LQFLHELLHDCEGGQRRDGKTGSGDRGRNIREHSAASAIKLSPEQALEFIEFIEDDELVEVTPNFIRIRKRYLKESDRKRYERDKEAANG
jgi:predicted membrane GTPase involved in stress response